MAGIGQAGSMTSVRMGRSRLLVVALSILAVVLTLVLISLRSPAAPSRGGRVGASAAPSSADPLAVLHAWDARRSAAWAAGDPRALRDLYASGSAAGARDVRMLRHYLDRDLRVTDLAVQVLAVRVRHRSTDRLTLVVTDRVIGGVATGPGVAVPLPTDAPSRRLVSLRRVAGEWLVDEVRDRSAS